MVVYDEISWKEIQLIRFTIHAKSECIGWRTKKLITPSFQCSNALHFAIFGPSPKPSFMIRLFVVLFMLLPFIAIAQQEEILPPILPWKGKSLELVAKKGNPWITPTEQNEFVRTPSYTETMAWFTKLNAASDVLEMVTVGQSANGRKIEMVIASQDKTFDKAALRSSTKPLLLVQAGIHAGEIDGKDAGMMLLRDIAFGNKKDLLKNVNLLFIPILNVDGHERVSPYNRPNQRGPENMGWRANARNLNLNRDYTKLDSEEIRAVAQVMNDYNPSFYVDLHVTDGADYQYDITYGNVEYSPAIAQWLEQTFRPAIDKGLKSYGHIPGPLIFATNDRDFTQGRMEFPYMPRFSTNYGDVRRIPSILVENHSLKPFKQRVLGTYVFLEALLQVVGKESAALKKVIQSDAGLRSNDVVITWVSPEKPDTVTLLGVESTLGEVDRDFGRLCALDWQTCDTKDFVHTRRPTWHYCETTEGLLGARHLHQCDRAAGDAWY